MRFEELELRHRVNAGSFKLFNQVTREGETLRSVAHGDGAAASVDIDARPSSDVAQHAQHLGDIFGADCCGEYKSLLRFQAVLTPLLRRVWSDEQQSGIHGAPKGARLRAEQGHARVKIHIINT